MSDNPYTEAEIAEEEAQGERERIENEGRRDFRDRCKVYNNPYHGNRERMAYWLDGFRAAREEAR